MTMTRRAASLATLWCSIAFLAACKGQTNEERSFHLATEQPDTLIRVLAEHQAMLIEAVSNRSGSAHPVADYLHPQFWLVDLRRGSADSVSYYTIVNAAHALSIELDVASVPELLSSDPPTLKSRLSGGDNLVVVWKHVDGNWKSMKMIITT